MRRGLLLLFPILLIMGAILWRPPTGSGSPEPSLLPKKLRDREGRVLFKTERSYRLYYTGGFPPPEPLRPFFRRISSRSGPPYLLAEGLSPSQASRYADLPGVLLEAYYAPRYASGPIFSPLIRRLRLPRSPEVRLTLAWEVQEVLYRVLRKHLAQGARLGGGVVDLTTGEIYALVNLPEDKPALLLSALYPPGKELSGAGVFGERTGIELPDSPGVYWPSGEILATPLQMVRALAERICGQAPRLHLIKESRPLSCRVEDRNLKREYIYKYKDKWIWLKLWPKGNPRFILVLAGEGVSLPRDSIIEVLYRPLYRWLPREARGDERPRGFPDLRGLTLRAALERLPRGVRVEFEGVGKVVRQWPRPGTPWKKVKSCKLYLRDAT